MLDFLLGLSFAGLFVRGWLRGLVREAMDLAGLLIGIAVAFRLSGPAGVFVSSLTGVGDPTARALGGVLVFMVVGLGAAVASHYLQRVANLPGLRLSNRLLGAGLALSWGLFLATLMLSVALVLPMPGTWHDSISNSVVAGALTDPDAPTHRLFTAISGDEVLDSVLSLQELLGERSVILEPDDVLELEPAEADELEDAPAATDEIYELLNLARLTEGLDALAWSDALAAVAAGHAREMYLQGYFAHISPVTGTVGDRVTVANISYRLVGENLALAATPRQLHDGLMSSPGHRENILRPEFRRVGIAAVRGPLGLMVVQVFTG